MVNQIFQRIDGSWLIDFRAPIHNLRHARHRHHCELLACCERQITAKRPVWRRASHLVRTPLPTAPKTLGEHLHKKRKALGLTQRQLAQLLMVSQPTLAGWEADQPSPTHARVIAWLGFDPQQPK